MNMADYKFLEIEKKWQKQWDKDELYKTSDDEKKEKYYILDMFPYPSGEGLHVGHPKGYIATDTYARMKMMQGFNVLHPMGWDAFGLPAENYAIKNKVHPRIAVEKNIAKFKSQLEKIGCTYDWSREVNTTDPEFYKWTQWTFLQMFNKGLAYESNEPVNWCPGCKTVLANEDLEDGRCERCDSEIERKPLRQWVLKITKYADRMLEGLDDLDWEDSIKEMQRNWIGRSEGASVEFKVKDSEEKIEVFTTRPDTLFGCTYMVLSPEHELISNFESRISNYDEVQKYIKNASKKSDLERTDLAKDKTGVKLEGVVAINPVNGEELPVYIADYVLANYGTGAIMAVPAHDERDFEFAKKYGVEIKKVVDGGDEELFVGVGKSINSGFLNGLETLEAKKKMIEWLEEEKIGKGTVNYKLNDWVFSRQRYWGEPIPIIHCEHCGAVGVPEKDLPVRLPEVEKYEPTGTGESPLAAIADWVNVECPKCGSKAKRETNTMPQWAGSSWYYLRYIDPKNGEALVDKKKEKYWSPVDFYVGGAEHATRHLIYARFWHKFLFDIGVVNYEEPFKKLQHVGLINAEDGRKMSKRWGNVIAPDDIIEKYGADTLRVYEMFMGPFSQPVAWSTSSMEGSHRFLQKVWKNFVTKELFDCSGGGCKKAPEGLPNILHKTIKKVTEDITNFRFNTAISEMMIFMNFVSKLDSMPKHAMGKFLQILAPFAPHMAEELWAKLGNKESIFLSEWPKYNPEMIKDKTISLVVQVNGKVRLNIEVEADITEDEAKEKALSNEVIKKWIDGKEIIKIIFVKGKLVNIVIK